MVSFEPTVRAELLSSVSSGLAKRRMSAFSMLGEDRCRTHVEATVDALEQDLEAGSFEAMRAPAIAFVSEFLAEGMGYTDLRFFSKLLREKALELAPADRREAVEEWCYQHLAVCTTHFLVQRDGMLQRQAEQRDIDRFESQLAELEAALAEKTQLLELIREASTPVTSVVRGILVVPLVGTFDRFRAELLAERLLDEVGQARARVAILDISGVPVFDTDAAQMIIRLARSVRLLGCKVILVGMSPRNARTIVELGIELDQTETCQALQDGLRKALALLHMKIVSMDGSR
jgi:anti-anti-sigma regulatory factor